MCFQGICRAGTQGEETTASRGGIVGSGDTWIPERGYRSGLNDCGKMRDTLGRKNTGGLQTEDCNSEHVTTQSHFESVFPFSSGIC